MKLHCLAAYAIVKISNCVQLDALNLQVLACTVGSLERGIWGCSSMRLNMDDQVIIIHKSSLQPGASAQKIASGEMSWLSVMKD
jgi:hypothetical protein